MGVGGFFALLGLRNDPRHISEFKGWRVGLDGTGFFCKSVYSVDAAAANGDPTDLVISGMELLLKKMIRYGVRPVLFIDGDNLPAKYETQQKRRQARLKQQLKYHRQRKDDDGWLRTMAQYKVISSDYRSVLVKLAQRLDIPYQVSLYEMDSQGVYSLRVNDVDIIASSDSDFAVYGCRNIFFDCDERGWGYFFNSAEDIPLALGIPDEEYTQDVVLKMALLRGNDFYGGVPGIGVVKCLEVVKAATNTDIDSLLQTIKDLYPSIYANMKPDCRDRLIQAEQTFRHATVYDVTTQCQVPLTPVKDEGVLLQQVEVFAGPRKSRLTATAISKGLIHPITHEPISEIGDPKTGFWSSSYVRPKETKFFQRGERKSAEDLGLDDCDAAPRKSQKLRLDCHICGKISSSFGNLKNHLRVHSAKFPFVCSSCKKCFKHKSNLNAHLVVHTKAKPYKCCHCNKSFSWWNTFHQHLQRHKGVKQYPCSICDKSFIQRCELVAHNNTHTGVRPYVCDVEGCGKSFATRSNLSTHKKTHSEDRLYKCSNCSASFRLKQHLDYHMITMHGTTGGVNCSICNQKFPSASHLKIHMASHSDPNFICTVCGAKFTLIANLKRHQDNPNSHDPKKKWSCTFPDCPRRFSLEPNLKRHIRQKH